MTRDDLIRNHEMLCNMARELMKKKNADYAGRNGVEPFAKLLLGFSLWVFAN